MCTMQSTNISFDLFGAKNGERLPVIVIIIIYLLKINHVTE